jgi:mono/diheme cytochrome c family protein
MKQIVALLTALSVCGLAAAQQRKPQAAGFPDAPGKEVLLSKCFQCHGPGMWMDQRWDRRQWESAVYRMVGRGALWTEDEIRQMAGYLGTAYGQSK